MVEFEVLRPWNYLLLRIVPYQKIFKPNIAYENSRRRHWFLLEIGCLRNEDGDGYENVT